MYLDSAIIVKLLVREADSDWFASRLLGENFETSDLALAEVGSALLAKERAGNITLNERRRAGEKFFSLVMDESILLLPLNRRVIERARAIQLACHPRVPLRTLDALHVATCDLHQSDGMCATDGRLRAAARQLGLPLVPENMEDLPLSK